MHCQKMQIAYASCEGVSGMSASAVSELNAFVVGLRCFAVLSSMLVLAAGGCGTPPSAHADALGETASPTEETVLAGMRSPSVDSRAVAARDAVHLPASTEVVSVLSKLATADPEARVRLRAVESLHGFEAAEADEALVGALGDSDSRIRSAAAHALRPEALQASTQALATILGSDPRWECRV